MNIDKLHIVKSCALSVSERKASLRSYMKKRRGENENRDVKEALLLENSLKSGAAERESFFVYMSFSSEAPTDKLIAYLLAQNKRVYCPRTEGGEIVPVEYGEDFSLSPYGIREPLGKAYEGKIDAAVLPLLAVDERGVRLGYGRGYYDRFLKRHPETKRIAYCFDFQLVREVPREEWDIPAEEIVTDKRRLLAKKRDGEF